MSPTMQLMTELTQHHYIPRGLRHRLLLARVSHYASARRRRSGLMLHHRHLLHTLVVDMRVERSAHDRGIQKAPAQAGAVCGS